MYDGAMGQYYLRARFYNPAIGRFLQEDVYRGDGLNLYAYCSNNPVMYYDPSGYMGLCLPGKTGPGVSGDDGIDGFLVGHGPGNVDALKPHLQVHPDTGKVIRIFFGGGK